MRVHFRSFIKAGPLFLDIRREKKEKKNAFYLLTCGLNICGLNNNSVISN